MKKLFVVLVMLVSMNASGQWVQMSNGIPNQWVMSFAVLGNTIFAGTANTGVYISTNYGVNWSQTSLNNKSIGALVVLGTNIFAGTESGVFKSTNNGNNWTQTALNNRNVGTLAVNANIIYAGSYDPVNPNGVILSTNNGASWTQTSLNNKNIRALATLGNNVFAGSEDFYGVYLSTNNGTSWTQTSLNGEYIYDLEVSGNNIFAGTVNGLYFSTNIGTSWTQTTLNNRNATSIVIINDNIFVGTASDKYNNSGYNGTIYLSTNNGVNWIDKGQGFGVLDYVHSLIIINNYIFAGTNNSVWRRLFSEIIGIQNISTETPSKYSLFQNYPNPFNPTTKIKFTIPSLSSPHGLGGDLVLLKVFDIMGREVQTLVNERLKPGTYETTFDGSTLNSGVYFYKLISGSFTETNRMLLIK
jgi:hypothetical protein